MIQPPVQPYSRLPLLQLTQHHRSLGLKSGKVAGFVAGPGVETGYHRQPRLLDRGNPRTRQIVLEVRA
jgi:hypothetical protein